MSVTSGSGGGKSFFELLSLGEWTQFQLQMAVRMERPSINITAFGRVPSSQIVHEGFGLIGLHAHHAKPVIYSGNKVIPAPDALMVVNDVPYCVEVKCKRVDPRYDNVMLDRKELEELRDAAEALGQEPIFVFYLTGTTDPHPEESIGDTENMPRLSEFSVMNLKAVESYRPEYSRGTEVYFIPTADLVSVDEWLEHEEPLVKYE